MLKNIQTTGSAETNGQFPWFYFVFQKNLLEENTKHCYNGLGKGDSASLLWLSSNALHLAVTVSIQFPTPQLADIYLILSFPGLRKFNNNNNNKNQATKAHTIHKMET